MRQVFFITDDRMTAMLWQRDELIAKYEFDARDTDQSALDHYLENSKDITASVILDVLEEEIMLTAIPHVAAHERKFLIERKMARINRSSLFSTASIIGRDDGIRKDDRLLVSSLTSDKTLLKWLDKFNQHNLLLKGIYSLPLIADQVLKTLQVEKGLILMVSRQSRDFIRQSIYKDGKLFYSRNIPSSQKFDLEVFVEDLKKTKKYLENQKLLSSNEAINVLVLSSDNFFTQLRGLDDLLPDMDFSYVKYDELKKSLGIGSAFDIRAREIFAALLLSVRVKNHYGRKSDLQRYRQQQKNNWLTLSTIAASVLLVMVSAKLYIDTQVINKKIIGLGSQVTELRKENDKLQSDLSRLPVKAASMRLFIENVADIKRQSAKGIDTVMIRISQVFDAYPAIEVKEIKWNISSDDLKKQIKNNKRNRNNRSTTGKENNQQAVNVTAHILTDGLSKQKIKASVEGFMASLKKIKAVDKLIPQKQAVNGSSNRVISGVLSDMKTPVSEFSFTIVMEDDSLAS